MLNRVYKAIPAKGVTNKLQFYGGILTVKVTLHYDGI